MFISPRFPRESPIQLYVGSVFNAFEGPARILMSRIVSMRILESLRNIQNVQTIRLKSLIISNFLEPHSDPLVDRVAHCVQPVEREETLREMDAAMRRDSGRPQRSGGRFIWSKKRSILASRKPLQPAGVQGDAWLSLAFQSPLQRPSLCGALRSRPMHLLAPSGDQRGSPHLRLVDLPALDPPAVFVPSKLDPVLHQMLCSTQGEGGTSECLSKQTNQQPKARQSPLCSQPSALRLDRNESLV